MADPAEHDATSGPPPDDFREHSLGYQVNLLARMMEHALAERIRPHGVVPGQFAQLLTLYRSDGLSVTELASAVAIEHSTMSRTVERMVRDDLVTTKDNPSDGRRRNIFLTDTARALEGTLKAEAQAVNDMFLDRMSHDELEELLRLLKKAVDSRST